MTAVDLSRRLINHIFKMASEEKHHVQTSNRKRKRPSLSEGLKPKSSPSSSSTVNSQAPRGINVVEFAEARALELHNMVEGIHMADRTGKKRLFQSLPKHMRRRAMSHNVKRMPVRLREQAKKEMDPSKLDSKSNKKSRRQRRKTKVLLDDYNRRKKENIWLETHIWHAKRMKMVNAWGYRLPEHPTDKGFRAAHRAVANNCLLQDISYYGCIEIKGDKTDIVSAMSMLTKTELGPTIGSLDCMNSSKEGRVMLYHQDQYPFGAIGPVSFLWKQNYSGSNRLKNNKDKNGNSSSCSVNNNDTGYQRLSQLWIWVHPACFDEVFRAVEEACRTVTASVGINKERDNTLLATQEKNNNSDTKHKMITVTSLRFDLVRFRLTGPLSHPLLVNMLEISSHNKLTCNESRWSMETGNCPLLKKEELIPELNSNVETYEADIHVCSRNNGSQGSKSEKINLLSSEDFWERMKSASTSSVLPPYSVIALTVIDPRLGMPGIRTSIDNVMKQQQTNEDNPSSSSSSSYKNSTNTSPQLIYAPCPSHVAESSIWDSETRHHVKETKVEEQKLNKMRSELLVPGSRLDLGDMTSHIPVILVQQPGSNGYGEGWDIILPSGWAMAFWMALVYRGARVGGLRESRNGSLEREEPYFPRDVPDTRSGLDYNRERKTEEENKYSRYPPAKRPNYSKLGTPSPFFIPWSQLVKEWSLEAQKHETFSLVGQKIDNESSLVRQEIDIDTVENGSISLDETNRFFVLRDLAHLNCLRKTFDKLQGKRSKFTGNDTLDIQPLIEITKTHPLALVGVSLRMLNKGCPLPNATVSIPTTADLETLQTCKTFSGPIEPLHKGSKQNMAKFVADDCTMIGCCTRKVIGFVTSGQYSLSRGYGVGIAYCALPGIVELLTASKQAVVLIRNTTTQQYRLALIRLL